MILIDTSVWVEHLRSGLRSVQEALGAREVMGHPFVVAEVACGRMARRAETLRLLSELPQARVASNDEILSFIEMRSLMGRGLSFVDVSLPASSTLAPGTSLWTRDRRLAEAASNLGIAIRT